MLTSGIFTEECRLLTRSFEVEHPSCWLDTPASQGHSGYSCSNASKLCYEQIERLNIVLQWSATSGEISDGRQAHSRKTTSVSWITPNSSFSTGEDSTTNWGLVATYKVEYVNILILGSAYQLCITLNWWKLNDWFWLDTVLSAPTSRRIRNTISTRWLANTNRPVAMLFIISGARMNILFIIKVRILVVIKWSYKSPPLWCWLLNLQCLTSSFEQVVQSLSNTW